MKYIKQLDGLRAIAVLAVIAHHWVSDSVPFAEIIHFGAYGVDLFFVISGFLITTILLKEKSKGLSLKDKFKIFWVRRALRIFPVYYLFITALFIFEWQEVKAYAPSLITYFFNFDLFFNGWPSAAYTHHLWSLSVEEQFYLVWPFLVLALPYRKSLIGLASIFVLSMVLSTAFYLLGYQSLKVFSPYAFMALSLGGLLAYARDMQVKFRYHLFFVTIFAVSMFCLKSNAVPHFPGRSLLGIIIPLPAMMFFFIVDKTADGFQGLFKKLLESRVMVFIGKISYGLYVYHMVVPFVFLENSTLLNVVLNSAALLVLCTLSWYLIENPINKLKSRFTYSGLVVEGRVKMPH